MVLCTAHLPQEHSMTSLIHVLLKQIDLFANRTQTKRLMIKNSNVIYYTYYSTEILYSRQFKISRVMLLNNINLIMYTTGLLDAEAIERDRHRRISARVFREPMTTFCHSDVSRKVKVNCHLSIERDYKMMSNKCQ